MNNEIFNSQFFCINSILEGVVDAMGFEIFSWWLMGIVEFWVVGIQIWVSKFKTK
jgi:hypothetical protein